MELAGPLLDVMERIVTEADTGRAVCVLASGDPGFFGIVRVLAERFGSERLAVHPAPSSVALAFARAGTSWDDATVVSAHGRPLPTRWPPAPPPPRSPCSPRPTTRPQAVGRRCSTPGCGDRPGRSCPGSGEDGEAVARTDLDGLAAGTFDPMSVVVLRRPTAAAADRPSLAWGRHESAFAHRAGMITKAEVRAVALGKLGLPPAGVLWDVGAGSGSVAIEAARPGARPAGLRRGTGGNRRRPHPGERRRHGVHVDVVVGDAPAALAALPDPDRVFVGGGGIEVLDACLARLRPGGTVVANYALVDRAVAAWQRLGNMVQIQVARPPASPTACAWPPRTPSSSAGARLTEATRSPLRQGEPLERLTGHGGDQLEILVEVQDDQPGELRRGGDDQVWDRGPPMVPLVGQHGLNLDRGSSIVGVRYSTGIEERGGRRRALRRSFPERAENPISSRVTVATLTSPRSIRSAHRVASGLPARPVRADLSTSQVSSRRRSSQSDRRGRRTPQRTAPDP